MAHIILIVTGLTGKLNISFELSRRLEGAGHQITYTSADDIGGVVEAHRFTFASFAADVQTYSTGAKSFHERRQRAIEARGIDKFTQVIQDLAPDLLLFDIELHAYIIASFPLAIPKALLSPFFSIWKHRNVPPLHNYIVPGEGWRGHPWNIERAWWQYRLKRWLQIKKHRMQSRWLDNIVVSRHLADRAGFPYREEMQLYDWLQPFSYRTLPVLNTNAWELEFPHTPRSGVYYVGPMIRVDREETRVEQEVDKSLEQIFRQHKQHGNKRALIYCAFTTYHSSKPTSDHWLVQRLIHVAQSQPEWDLILGLGGLLEPKDFGVVPSNIHLLQWAPQLKVLRHADCALIQGGPNSINECIQMGVPMVVYSGNRNDQNGNAARVVYHGLGLRIDQNHERAKVIEARLEQVLGDPSFKTKVMQMRDRIQHYERDNRVAQVVESLLSKQDGNG